jgi:hypothetical protein
LIRGHGSRFFNFLFGLVFTAEKLAADWQRGQIYSVTHNLLKAPQFSSFFLVGLYLREADNEGRTLYVNFANAWTASARR